MRESQTTFFVRPGTVALVLSVLVAVLVSVCTTAQVIRLCCRMPRTGVFAALDLDGEFSLPSLLSSAMLLAAAALLHVIARASAAEKAPFVRHWRGLSVIFVLLGLDDACSTHELLIRPMRGLFGASGIFHFAWLIPGLVFVAILCVLYLRFVLAQPRPIRDLFLLAATLFLSGAVGMEMVAGDCVSHCRCWTGLWLALTTVEETLEMAGVTVFLYALLRHIADSLPNVRIAVGSPPESSP